MRHIRILSGIVALAAGCTESTKPFDPEQELVLSAASSTAQTVIAGNTVSDVPTVIVHDPNGAPRAGVVIVFNVTSGTSAIAGAIDTTNALGIARVQSWSPSPKAGSTTAVTARAPNGLTTVFVATVVTGPPGRMAKLAGDNQIASPQTPVAVKPVVHVTDFYDNPVTGVHVRFEIMKGGGSISPAEVVTDADGNATLSSWTLGDKGDQLLVASLAGIAQTFRASAIENPSGCSEKFELIPVATLAGSLTDESCTQDGRFFRIYYLNVTSGSSWAFAMRSSAFDSYLEIRDSRSRLIARNNDADGSTKDSRMTALLTPGVYQLIAFSNTPGVAGAFLLSLADARSAPAGCDGLFVMKATSVDGQLLPRTCGGSSSLLADSYRIHLETGDKLDIRLRDKTYSGFELNIMDNDGKFLAQGQQTVNYLTYGITYEADRDIDLVIRVSSADSYAEYTIDFQ